jgi:hypothetical protein
MDSNDRPLPCQGSALTRLSYGPTWELFGQRAIPATFGSWLFPTLGRSYPAALFDRKIRSAWHGNGIVNYLF